MENSGQQAGTEENLSNEKQERLNAQVQATFQTQLRAEVTLLADLDESQRRDYRRRHALALSIIEPYTRNRTELTTSKTQLQTTLSKTIKANLYALAILGAVLLVNWLFFQPLTSRQQTVIFSAFFGFLALGVIYEKFIGAQYSNKIQLHEQFVEHYLQQWHGLELPPSLLFRLSSSYAIEQSEVTYTLEELESDIPTRHEIEKYDLAWELKTELISRVSNCSTFTKQIELSERDEWPYWSRILSNVNSTPS
jgi:hypothetical protein